MGWVMGWYGVQAMVSGCSRFHHMLLELEPDDRIEAMPLASLVSILGAVPLHFLWLSPSMASTGQTWYCSGLLHIPSDLQVLPPSTVVRVPEMQLYPEVSFVAAGLQCSYHGGERCSGEGLAVS